MMMLCFTPFRRLCSLLPLFSRRRGLTLLGGALVLSAFPSAWAGLEILDGGEHSHKPQSSSDLTSGRTPKRVQVFGNGEVRTLNPKEELKAEPDLRKTSPALVSTENELEFEQLRRKIRSHQVAEAENEERSVGVAEKGGQPKTPPRKTVVPVPRPTPSPTLRMETEVVKPPLPTRGSPAAPVVSKEVSSEEIEYVDGERNIAFPYTHLLPSPFNIQQGSWFIGTTAAYGVFDSLQISTDVVRLIDQHWNVQAKVPLVDYPTFMATAFVNFESYNPRRISPMNPDARYDRWQPGVVTAFEIAPTVAFFLGGNFSFGKDPLPVVRTSGYLKGARLETDFSWVYNPESSSLGDNALSMGVTYDTTYSMLGFGVSHHWRAWSVGVHYTLADEKRFLPIFGFSLRAGF